jgi:hypothetical protein
LFLKGKRGSFETKQIKSSKRGKGEFYNKKYNRFERECMLSEDLVPAQKEIKIQHSVLPHRRAWQGFQRLAGRT